MSAPLVAPATAQEAGRNCPYCRFPLKEGASATRCGACQAPHHSDCWSDNGGCAMMGCAGAPGQAMAATAQTEAASGYPHPSPPTTYAEPPQVAGYASPVPTGYQAPPQHPAAPPPDQNGGGGRWLVAAVVVLALVVAGSTVAVILTRQGSTEVASAAATATATPTAETTPAVEAATATPEPVEDTEPASLATMSPSEIRSGATDLIRSFHQDIQSGDTSSAFALMTQRKQDKANREGYGSWVQAQSFGRDLDLSGLRVRVDDVDTSTGVVRVDVRGMGYSGPGAGNAGCDYEWSGITWVRWEDGRFLYDPGYSTTPQREAEWKPRSGELLGWNCQA